MKLDRFVMSCAAAVALLHGSVVSQTTFRVSVDSNGVEGNGQSGTCCISANGRYVVFASESSNFATGDVGFSPDIFVHDALIGSTTIVSVDSAGTQSNGPNQLDPNSQTTISADGRYVVFLSGATNLVPGDTNGSDDIFVHDLWTGSTIRASVDSAGNQGNSYSSSPCISADGRYVAFVSAATNLVPGDTNGTVDVFVHDLSTGSTALASVDSAGGQSNDFSSGPSISGDGRYVAFLSRATNLVPGDTNAAVDVFVHDRQTGLTKRASIDSSGMQGDLDADFFNSAAAISADGRFVAFASSATNLVTGDTNGVPDVFVHDLMDGTTSRVSVDSNHAQGNGYSYSPSISADGRYVAFDSEATNLVPADLNGKPDVFIHDRLTGTTALVSVDSSGMQANANCYRSSISADGRFVAFDTSANDLVPGDTNGYSDVFIRDRGAPSSFVAHCFGDGSGVACPCGNSGAPGHGCENSAGTLGAVLSASGVASLGSDTVQLTCSGELPTALSIALQGSSTIPATSFGDGLLCAGGAPTQLYVRSAIGGVFVVPAPTERSISQRSATIGDLIPLGGTRIYQVYYRDGSQSFCPEPMGAASNMSNAIAIAWGA